MSERTNIKCWISTSSQGIQCTAPVSSFQESFDKMGYVSASFNLPFHFDKKGGSGEALKECTRNLRKIQFGEVRALGGRGKTAAKKKKEKSSGGFLSKLFGKKV